MSITHEELIAAGYKDKSQRDHTDEMAACYVKELDHERTLALTDEYGEDVWEYEHGDFYARFLADTIEEAEKFTHLLHAASQGLPKVKKLLDDAQEYVVSGYCDRADMNKHLTEAEAELGLTANRNPPRAEMGGAG